MRAITLRRADQRLRVGGRDRTKLVEAMAWPVEVVTDVLDAAGTDAVVMPMLCFVGGNWGWVAKPFMVRRVAVAWPLAMADILQRPRSTRQHKHHSNRAPPGHGSTIGLRLGQSTFRLPAGLEGTRRVRRNASPQVGASRPA
jgi:hypothetical protein